MFENHKNSETTSEKKIKVEIVTPVYNRREITLQCLKVLQRISGEHLQVHIIVVDDASPDGTAEAIKNQYPNVEVINGDGELWYTEGTNVGVIAALKHQPDYILAINDDAVFDADFLKYMIETAEKNPKSIVGSLLLLWDTPHKLFQVAPVFEVLSGGWRHWQQQTVWTVPKRVWKVDIIVGNCVLYPAQVFLENGFMDSKRFPAFGDTEFTPRLKRKGWKLLIEPRARVFCLPNTMPKKVSTMSRKEKFSVLWSDLRRTQNLRRKFYANLVGAPNRLKGLVAYAIFFVRIALKKNVDKIDFSKTRREKPLSETFASSIVNE